MRRCQRSELVVLVVDFELFIPHAQSLKEKRSVVRSLINQIKAKNNVSIVEADYNDLWQRSRVVVAAVSLDHGSAQVTVNEIKQLILAREEAILGKFNVHYHEVEAGSE